MKTPALVMQQVYSLTRAMYYGAADARIAARPAWRVVREQIAKMQAQGPWRVARGVRSEGRGARRHAPVGGGGRGGRGGGRGGPAACGASRHAVGVRTRSAR